MMFYTATLSQQVYNQDIFKGGVCFAGFSAGLSSGGGSFETYVEPGSTIKKVLLIYNIHNYPSSPIDIVLDGISIEISNSAYNGKSYRESQFESQYVYKIGIIDITDFYQNQTTHNITIPDQSTLNCGLNCFYGNFSLLITYENPSLSTISYTLIFNDQQLDIPIATYSSLVNPIDINYPVGFSINSDIINSPSANDGSTVWFEEQNIGLIGGADNVNSNFSFGTRGHFYYQNFQLQGLDDDTNDSAMSNSDALADVSSFIGSNVLLSWHLDWQNAAVHQNVYTSYIFTYKSLCNSFPVNVTKDTTVNVGTQVQLNVSGGQFYNWAHRYKA